MFVCLWEDTLPYTHLTTPHLTHLVTKGLPAANVDLRDSDIVLEVEGTDVRRANGPEVVDIVR